MDLVEDLNDLICWCTGSHHIWSLKRAEEKRIVSILCEEFLWFSVVSALHSFTLLSLCSSSVNSFPALMGTNKDAKHLFFNKSASMLAVTDWRELENSLLRAFSNQSFSLCIEWRMFWGSCVMLVGRGQFTLNHSSLLNSGGKNNWLQLVSILSCY